MNIEDLFNHFKSLSSPERVAILEEINREYPFDYAMGRIGPSERKFYSASLKREP